MKGALFAFLAVLMLGSLNVYAEEPMNVLKNVPYEDTQLGKRKVVDEKHLLIMQIALKPGQVVPLHPANSNVHVLVLEGKLLVTLAGQEHPAEKGDLVPVAFKTPMTIVNTGTENATFLVIKTPNPSEMQQ